MRFNQFFPAFSRLARRLWPGLAVLALALPLAWAVATTATLPPPAWAQDNTPQPATPGTPTPEPGTPEAPTPTPTPEPIDYDADDDLQIEVTTLQQLNALRYDLNGDGVVDWPDGKRPNKNRKNEDGASEPGGSGALIYAGAFPNAAENMGCESACRGYELTADLTFDSNGDNAITAADGKLSWNDGAGWTPIGSTDAPYNARFQGNGHTIAHLFIDNRDAWEVGLFGVNSGEVREVGLTDAQVSGRGVRQIYRRAGRLQQSRRGRPQLCNRFGNGRRQQSGGGRPGRLQQSRFHHPQLRRCYGQLSRLQIPGGRPGRGKQSRQH